ncbi:MAG: lipopolysaccharide biosynthesis protein [Cyclobacteriaceae bacterium]
MATPLKKLAGETAIYGIPSILGRFINFLLVAVHTGGIFSQSDYGNITYLYAYVSFLNIIYTYGMETSFFRFATKGDLMETYHRATSSVILTSLIFTALIYFGAAPLADFMLKPELYPYIQWLALILFIDAVVAIPFAKLRLQHKAKKFAFIRMSGILINVILQVVFLYFFPKAMAGDYGAMLQDWVGQFYKPTFGIGYVFLANFIGNLFMLLMLWRSFWELKFTFNWGKVKPMLSYGIPILLMGLAGISNDQIEKILFEYLLPDNFYPGLSSSDALGVYSASFKLSVFMSLAVQAFRFAGEPFFFSQSQDKAAPALFAKVLHYFVVFSVMIYVGISLNLEFIAQILLGERFRGALEIVPILMLGKLFFGIYINISIWFKLTDKTIYGTYISVVGAVITVAGNVILVPILGYMGCAVTIVLSFFTMAAMCYFLGQKYYPIPYKLGPITGYVVAGLVVVLLMQQVNPHLQTYNPWANMLITAVFIVAIYFIEKAGLSPKTT